VSCCPEGQAWRRAHVVVLTDFERAGIFQALGRALGAGLSPVQALEAMQGLGDAALDARLRRVASALRKGTALTAALDRLGLLAAADQPLLAAAEATGTLDRVCERLARRYERAGTRWRKLKGRLLLPGAVLVIGIVVLPLPAVAAGRLSGGGYLLRTGALLALLALLAKLASMLARRWRAHGTPGMLTAVARLLPGLGSLSRLQQRADVCERLAVSLQCGLPAADALDALRHAERNVRLRADLVAARSALGAGTGVADALGRAGLLDRSGYAIVSAGEAAGGLDETLARVAGTAHDALDDAWALLAQWIPVLVYLLVAGTVAAGLIG